MAEPVGFQAVARLPFEEALGFGVGIFTVRQITQNVEDLKRMWKIRRAERQTQRPEYLLHQNDIDMALAEFRQGQGR